MTLSPLNPTDAAIARLVSRAERERDLCDRCAAASEHDGDELAAQEFTAEAADWQDWIDQMEAACA